ncbi:MAG: hypothetical protein WCH98_01660 [Verrucomicrobiota bacterium]
MKTYHIPFTSRNGAALVIILAFLVLLTVLVLAFFSRTLTERQVSNSSAAQIKADLLAHSAADMIVADLKQEIADPTASTAKTDNGVTIYTPIAPANMLPVRSGNPPVTAGVDPIPNLVRRSVRSDPIAAPGVASRASAVNSTTNPSLNGRSVPIDRWNSHYLIPRHNTGTTIDSTPISPLNTSSPETYGFTPPDWVMVTTNGPQVLTAPDATVIGRYAYAIYDEGGLLDVNVAGYPSSTTVAQSGSKRSLAFADLTQLPTSASGTFPQNQVDNIVGWRNYVSAQPTGTLAGNYAFDTNAATRYYNYVISNSTGFLSVNPQPFPSPATTASRTDQMFTSRQALLRFRRATGFSQNALQYLGTFSRELNAPSWGPTQNASDLGGTSVPAFDYKANRDSAAAANRFIPNVRVASPGTITSYRNDGSSYTYRVKAGEPLIQRRFPLGRLNWIGPSGPQNGGTPASIQACFGLLWGPTMDATLAASNPGKTANVWKYVGATGATELSTIKTLSQIAAEPNPREPNFFELLQAGILSGSLAMEAHTNAGAAFNINMNYYTTHEKSPTLHVLRVGASIISQAQGSIYPIVVEYDQSGQPWQAAGVANLPYLNMLNMLTGKSSDTSLQCYMMFGLSNPHQMPQGTSAARPPVRLRVKGQITVANNYGRHTPGYARNPLNMPSFPYSYVVPNLDATVMLSSDPGSGVNGFIDPHALLATDITPAPGPGTAAGLEWAALPSFGGNTYAGYRLPDYLIDKTDSRAAAAGETPALPDIWADMWFAVNTNLANPFNCWLEFQNPNGIWVPYNYHAGINNQATWFCKSPGFYAGHLEKAADVVELHPIDSPSAPSIFYYMKYYWETVDPCSLRFNYTQPRSGGSQATWAKYLNGSLWSSATDPVDQAYGRTGLQVIPYLFGSGGWNPASLSRNNTPPQPIGASNGGKYAAYKDPDGVQRIADSGLYTTPPNTSSWQGDPMAYSADRVKDRPIILNRPFSSVADLGYASRDYPWRTLDFFTANSADAGLLDLFTINESDSSAAAGRINLNTRNAKVLEAVLSGTTSDVVGNTAVSKASTIAGKLAQATAVTPLVGRDEIATKFVPTLLASDFGTTDEQNVKSRREGVTRALADVGQTRTWNLMIDVIAQAGRYPPGATTLDKFVVEGERRFWLHVAIDRFTGEVIDQQLEPVIQ